MSAHEPTNIESKRSVYDTCDRAYLRELREAAGMDLVVLARIACLSVAQVRELETEGSDNLFYSEAIKRQAYKRLLMILGAEPPTVEVPEELQNANQVTDAHLNTLDQIVAMSHQPAINRSTSNMVGAGVSQLKEHKQVMGALLLLLVAVGLFVLHGLQATDDLVVAAASSPVDTASVAPAPLASAPVATPMLGPVASTPAPAPAPAAAPVVAACAYISDAMPQLTPFIVHKEGSYVYVVSPINAEICVVDGNKKASVLQLKAGEGRSVYGVSPWQVSASNLSKLQIFFQGGRVSMPDAATRVKLVEVPVLR